ncbi:MAG: TspO/MBR family protein [Patescibacteria group bacterium]|jgi:tryptophan-rich sensory protein
MHKDNFIKLAIAVVIAEAAGIIGSFFTAPSIPSWYATLPKPAFNPPAWIFAPVWTALFALMGIAAFLIWKKGLKRKDVKIALAIFIGQLVLNALWSFIFFGLHNPKGAFFELIVLWLAILATIISFYRISKSAAWLLLPYILWVSFAGYLNYSIWQLAAKAPEQVNCTMEARLCPDGSAVGRIGPNCEFVPCPETNAALSLPKGYSLDSYKIEKVLDMACVKNTDCFTSGEYILQSRCPFTSLCLENKCTVVCPAQTDLSWPEAEAKINNCEAERLSQNHDRQVTLFLKDRRRLKTVEPTLDLIISLYQSVQSKCGKIPIATE